MELTKNTDRLIQATIYGAGICAYYATPDFIRSRTGRFFAKSACLASIAVASAAIDSRSDARETCPTCNSDSERCDTESSGLESESTGLESESTGLESESTGLNANEAAKLMPKTTAGKIALLSGLTGALVASTTLEIAIERAIFRRGERRRAQGVTLAHSRFGLGLGLAFGVFSYLTSDTEQNIVS